MDKKVQLPPIEGLVGDLPRIGFEFTNQSIPKTPQVPPFQIPIHQNETELNNNNGNLTANTDISNRRYVSSVSPRSEEPSLEDQNCDSGRSAPYTLKDDLMIFKVVASFYGFGFHGKIPWSFWQTYKRVTGSNRSNSSLYHHWNGAMKKKYEAFIDNGRLSDCILWLETAVMAEQTSPSAESIPFQHTGTPLFHNKSQPSIPLGAPKMNFQNQPLSLVRTGSCSNSLGFPFSQIH
ncbi:hypothetical protein M9Y10_004433 [Tritrichomonas musculus]|uniref:Myb-like domain-containing protein n=1 Tax=Tritrichomonas musculus TaxID=1915356 RepID=A0ABR2JT95_9EUKA